LTDLFVDKVTVYISVPATSVKPRTFERRVIDKCQIQGGFVEKADGTIRNVVNAQTVITRDVVKYVKPFLFESTPQDVRQDLYTVQVGDFVVFGEVDDIVSDAEGFAKLQQKYKEGGIKVTSVNAAINGMPIDNITITNA
jgi:hypothetical protein